MKYKTKRCFQHFTVLYKKTIKVKSTNLSFHHKIHPLKVVSIYKIVCLLPACSSLTSSEQAQLDSFDAQIATLKAKLATLKGNLATKVEDLTNLINTQYTNLNNDILVRTNRTKTKRLDMVTKCNTNYQSKTAQYRKQLKKKTQSIMNQQYAAQYQSALASRNGATNPLISELNTIRTAMGAPMSK